MTEVILGVVILALLAFTAFKERLFQEERNKYINAMMSKSSQDFRDLELTSKVQPITPTQPEFTAESELDDEAFMEQIKEQA